MSKVGQLYPKKREWYLIPLVSLKTKILKNFEFVFLKEDIHRFISSTELFLSDIGGLRNTGFKKVNFFVGHPVYITIFTISYFGLSLIISLYFFLSHFISVPLGLSTSILGYLDHLWLSWAISGFLWIYVWQTNSQKKNL